MKLLDKLKDLFMDEVDVDDEIEIEDEKQEIKLEPKTKKTDNILPKVMRDTIKKEEKTNSENVDELDSKKNDTDAKKVYNGVDNKKFNFPIDFELDTPPSRSTVRKDNLKNNTFNEKIDLHEHKEKTTDVRVNRNINAIDYEKTATNKLSDLYSKKQNLQEKPKFKATPVISPVYGVLDKNYKKDEVKERNEEMVEMKRPSKKVDFETVRKKAFGNLADDIKDNMLCENCELYKEVKKISQLKEDDLLYDMTVDDNTEVTIEKAYDNYAEFGVAYEPKNTKLEVHEEVEEIKVNSEEANNDKMRFDDIISNVNMIDETIINDSNELDNETLTDKPNVVFDNKVEENLTPLPNDENEDKVEDVPSRSEKKKDEKVDEEFFELIDSMYKERTED